MPLGPKAQGQWVTGGLAARSVSGLTNTPTVGVARLPMVRAVAISHSKWMWILSEF